MPHAPVIDARLAMAFGTERFQSCQLRGTRDTCHVDPPCKAYVLSGFFLARGALGAGPMFTTSTGSATTGAA